MANAHDSIDGLIAQYEGGGSVKKYKEGGKTDHYGEPHEGKEPHWSDPNPTKEQYTSSDKKKEIPENIKKQLEYSGSDEHRKSQKGLGNPFGFTDKEHDEMYKESQREEYEKKHPVLSGKKTLKQVTEEGITKAKERTERGIKKQKEIKRDFKHHLEEAKSGEAPYQRA